MFSQIFFFEIKYRLKKPGVYIYFFICFILAFLTFGFGSLPLDEKQFINSPSSIAYYISMMSMIMMLASSAIMGVPLYRDIEYNTKEYYLSYPITRAGYFWGRFLGSFLFVVILAFGLFLGIYCGTRAGPAFGWESAAHYGPNRFMFYLHPFLTLALPNLFFTSSLFFGLVAILRNVKVIYSSGIMLFLGYLLANFFIHSSSNAYLIHLSDPFASNGVRYITDDQPLSWKNNEVISLDGLFLVNRLMWSGIGTAILLFTWFRFSFERFFRPEKENKLVKQTADKPGKLPLLHIDFKKKYNRPVLYSLTKIEVINIIRDNYFWIIIVAGSIFLGIIFSHGPSNFGVRDYRRTSMILFMFNNNFLIFLFCVIIFYTGEVIHRERTTGFSFVNDALPPPVWILHLAKVLSIVCLSIFLTIAPMLIGLAIQVSSGFYLFNFPVYFNVLFLCVLPKLVEMTMLSFVLHICIRHKFAALGIGIAYTVLCVLALQSGYMNYRLLLFSYTPFYAISDFDNVGHMMKPIGWFNMYWLLLGALLLIVGYLFYMRGTITSFKERMQLARERLKGNAVWLTAVLLVAFVLTAGFNYYNVSYLNHYYTKSEEILQKVEIEKKLKRYEDMPLPMVTDIKMFADLFPEKQRADFRSFVTIVNKTASSIKELLLDGDNVAQYDVKYNNALLSYTCPLFFARGKFNFFGPGQDSSGYRLYQLPQALNPGDTARLELRSSRFFKGFANDLYAAYFLHNGTFMGVGLPSLGYDTDEELRNEEERKEYGLPKRAEEFPLGKEAEGANILLPGRAIGLRKFELTVSTSADQIAIAPGNLEKKWKENGRNYFQYNCNTPGIYTPAAILSARYAELHDSVMVGGSRYIGIDIYYHVTHNTNLQRFVAAYKDGLVYYSKAFGPYPFKQVRLAESSVYAPGITSMAATDVYAERYGWNANFTDPNQFDFCYYTTAKTLAKQWWGNQVAPNHTKGSELLTEGLSKYCALVMCEKKYGKNNMRSILLDETNAYLWQSRWNKSNQNILLHATSWAEIDNKAGVVLYGLKDLVGEDNINAALREFRDAYAFRTSPPYAGTKELYSYLKKHVPDSLQYYLEDTWEKITFYDNRIIEAKAIRPDSSDHYKIILRCSTAKVYQDNKGEDKPATAMNDYIDIAVFGEDTKNKEGRSEAHPSYIQKHRLTSGEHTIEIMVTGKPVRVGIDPYLKLIDRVPADNIKMVEY